jgi:hypothetical protein
MVDVHVYFNILLFEAIAVAVKGFRLIEVKLFSSVDRLSHGECVSDRLIMSSDSGDKVFDG